jgi:hypothetical protein
MALADTPKDDLEELLNRLMPFAEGMLSKYGEFFPFGGSVAPDGKIVQTAAYDGQERQDSEDAIEMMTEAFRQSAREGKIKACAIFSDALVTPPGSQQKIDAVCVYLDHAEDDAVEVFFPYEINETKEVVLSEAFAQKGRRSVFGTEQDGR